MQAPKRIPSAMRVFVADSIAARRHAECEALLRDGHEVLAFEDGPALLDHLATLLLESGSAKPDVIVTEDRIGGLSALTVSKSLEEAGWDTAVVVISPSPESVTARSEGARAVLRPTADADDLRMTVMNVSA
jgi:CheY-like chemotaxis protein